MSETAEFDGNDFLRDSWRKMANRNTELLAEIAQLRRHLDAKDRKIADLESRLEQISGTVPVPVLSPTELEQVKRQKESIRRHHWSVSIRSSDCPHSRETDGYITCFAESDRQGYLCNFVNCPTPSESQPGHLFGKPCNCGFCKSKVGK